MVAMLRGHAAGPDLLTTVAAVTGLKLMTEIERAGDKTLGRNEISALLAVLGALCAAAELDEAGVSADFFAGYSVGLWSAIHLAGMIDRDTLIAAVWTRAKMMNQTRAAAEGGMLAVIGLDGAAVAEACGEASTPDQPVWIANFNCPGQYTLAGTAVALTRVRPLLERARPHKLVALPVQGAWHCRLLDSAVQAFRRWLDGIVFMPPRRPIVGNVVGAELPADPAALRDELAAHIARPVQWESAMRRLIALGAKRFVEVGYGLTLTKFGFFIDRSLRHWPYAKALDELAR